jgi:Na+/H+ antiporter NhaD/arsenite permease-like protein
LKSITYISTEHKKGIDTFFYLTAIQLVIASNAAGVISPFGDLSTLIVWQTVDIDAYEFTRLFLPAFIGWILPALFLSIFVPKGTLPPLSYELIEIKRGGKRVIALFILTLITAVTGQVYFGFPPIFGMIAGFVYLGLFSFYLKKTFSGEDSYFIAFDIESKIARTNWGVIFMLFGSLLCIGGLNHVGWSHLLSYMIFDYYGYFHGAIIIGLISAAVENVGVTYAVLNAMPDMTTEQILMLTFTAGTGGSLLTGSVAGAFLMSESNFRYKITHHLKYIWVLMPSYLLSSYLAMHILT